MPLRRLLTDPVLQKTMGAAAAKRISSAFTLERMIDDTLALYRDVIAIAGHGKTAA